MLSIDPLISPAEIKRLLIQGADPISDLSPYLSGGALNAYQSLALLQGNKDSASAGSEPVAHEQGTGVMAVSAPASCSLIPD